MCDALAQSRAASALTVDAPWPRLRTSVWLTLGGRSDSVLLSVLAALAAWVQEPALTAWVIALSCEAIVELSSADSRLLLSPQATTKAAANPRPPAISAREPNPIWRLTLEAGPITFTLGSKAPYCPYCRRSASESGSRAARIAAAAPAMS